MSFTPGAYPRARTRQPLTLCGRIGQNSPSSTEGGDMDEQHDRRQGEDADELLRRALLEPESSVAVALGVGGLALADRLTVVFHGRRDLGTVQTYVANGDRPAG